MSLSPYKRIVIPSISLGSVVGLFKLRQLLWLRLVQRQTKHLSFFLAFQLFLRQEEEEEEEEEAKDNSLLPTWFLEDDHPSNIITSWEFGDYLNNINIILESSENHYIDESSVAKPSCTMLGCLHKCQAAVLKLEEPIDPLLQLCIPAIHETPATPTRQGLWQLIPSLPA